MSISLPGENFYFKQANFVSFDLSLEMKIDFLEYN